MTTNVQFCDYISLILYKMRNVADKNYRQNQNTHSMFNHIFISENRALYEIMWKKKL